ncbi:unnamed protein product [Brassica rapa subsp. trilocularis]
MRFPWNFFNLIFPMYLLKKNISYVNEKNMFSWT